MSGKWKGMILYELLKDGSVRFATLQRQIPKVTSRMLTMQLRELENDGLVDRTVFAEVPPKVVYRLTPRGGSLKPIILAMEQWGKENI